MNTNIKRIPILEFKEKVDSNNYIILDIRTTDEFNQSRIKNSINYDIYDSNFKDKISQLNKNKKYLIYCQSGSISMFALSLFKQLEFSEVFECEGGLVYWQVMGYDIERE